jgi:1-acyl-sn-glycerol-3-phosphate acyltransferase
MNLLSIIGKLILKILGWKIEGNIPPDLKKAVIVCGPHTSNWDALYSLSGFVACKLHIRFAIKKEAMFFPLGWFLRGLGAIPIERGRCGKKTESMVDTISAIYKKYDSLYIAISPEGTRKYAERWKTGFYFIALNANVPIVLCYLDYEKKIAGFGPIIYPSGDIDKDIIIIKNFFKKIKGKYPENGIK